MEHPALSEKIDIRAATTENLATLSALDEVAAVDPTRVVFIATAIEEGRAYLACLEETILAYGVMGRFFGHPFIEMLYVARTARRSGVATRLMNAMEQGADGDRLFTSTNRSNSAMQALLSKREYEESGIVENLDPGDPEMFFVKFLPS